MGATGETVVIEGESGQADNRARSVRLPGFSLFKRTGFALPLAALAIGLWSLTTARQSAIGQYGLIQALPPFYFLSLAILTVIFVIFWRRPQPRFLEFLLSLITLVVLLQGAPGIVESEPRFAPA